MQVYQTKIGFKDHLELSGKQESKGALKQLAPSNERQSEKMSFFVAQRQNDFEIWRLLNLLIPFLSPISIV